VADLFGLSTREWRSRCEALATMGIWEVAQYVQGKGLAEEHVQRLALVAWAGDKGCRNTAAAGDWKEWRTANADYVRNKTSAYGDICSWPSGMEGRPCGEWGCVGEEFPVIHGQGRAVRRLY
jgi:hypothetical protein